ncbi:MAG TPA: helix-turn-helix domain-containing protein [Stellaceae bacterium]|nr:helix-turn-helix domain-containing protein [Stellaceae bacterium]
MGTREYDCGLAVALDVIGGKWKILILWWLRQAPRRFGELRRSVNGISEKMLIQSLKELEQDGIVSREDYKVVPPRVEYQLTPLGHSLCDALTPLCNWGQMHLEYVEALKTAAQ